MVLHGNRRVACASCAWFGLRNPKRREQISPSGYGLEYRSSLQAVC